MKLQFCSIHPLPLVKTVTGGLFLFSIFTLFFIPSQSDFGQFPRGHMTSDNADVSLAVVDNPALFPSFRYDRVSFDNYLPLVNGQFNYFCIGRRLKNLFRV